MCTRTVGTPLTITDIIYNVSKKHIAYFSETDFITVVDRYSRSA